MSIRCFPVLVALAACAGPTVDDSADEGPGTPSEVSPWFAELAFFQAVEVPLIDGGEPLDSGLRNAPLIVGRPAVLRAYVDVAGPLSGGDLELAVDINSGSASESFTARRAFSVSSDVEDPSTGFVVSIPPAAMAEGASYSVTLRDGDEVLGRFPNTGELPLDAIVTGPLKVHLVPFSINGFTPDTSDSVVEGMRDALMAVYPVTEVQISVGDVVERPGEFDIGAINYELGVMQETLVFSGQLPRDVYYYGLVSGVATREEYRGSTGTSESGAGEPRAFFATGAAFGDQKSEDTLIHEMGHMHQLEHAACDDEPNTDPNFPYQEGVIGVEGYDLRTGTFVPATHKDMMAYCYPRWISDYHYRIMADHVVWSRTFNDQG